MINWYKIFYFLTVSDGLRRWFDVISDWFTVFSVLWFVGWAICRILTIASSPSVNEQGTTKDDKDTRAFNIGVKLAAKFAGKLFIISFIVCMLTWIGFIATPTKRDCIFILAGGASVNFLTTDSSAKAIPSDVMKFVHLELQDKIKDISTETKKELGLQTQTPKEKLLDILKTKGSEAAAEYLKNDTTLK